MLAEILPIKMTLIKLIMQLNFINIDFRAVA